MFLQNDHDPCDRVLWLHSSTITNRCGIIECLDQYKYLAVIFYHKLN